MFRVIITFLISAVLFSSTINFRFNPPEGIVWEMESGIPIIFDHLTRVGFFKPDDADQQVTVVHEPESSYAWAELANSVGELKGAVSQNAHAWAELSSRQSEPTPESCRDLVYQNARLTNDILQFGVKMSNSIDTNAPQMDNKQMALIAQTVLDYIRAEGLSPSISNTQE